MLQNKIFEDRFFISSITLQELENIKTSRNKDEETKYKARKILHLLDEKTDKYDVVIYSTAMGNYIIEKQVEVTPDTKIISCASFSNGIISNNNLVFVTNDIACKVIAEKIFNLKVESVCENDTIYKGYKIIKVGFHTRIAIAGKSV